MEDWDAVGAAIAARLGELRMTQQQLALASGVSPATIRELQHGRRRVARSRTLSALSTALGRPDGYLLAVLRGEPTPDKPAQNERDPVLEELDAIRAELHELRKQVAQVSATNDIDGRLAEITARISGLEARSAPAPRDDR